MGEKKQLNVRIPLELQEKIEQDGRPKVDIVIEALELYFASKMHQHTSNTDDSAIKIASQNDSKIGNIDSNLIQNYNKASHNTSNSSNDDSNRINKNNNKDNNIETNDSTISRIEQQDSNEILRMKTEIEFLRTKIDDLLKLLHQEQVLHIQTQRMLTAPQQPHNKWWHIWK
ncbi:MAG: hypothetical protein OIN87_10345 [Candidatus Methanoperedens sp.]|nr:hypothetical protein [Candidatus Methanoperedens sp.]